MKKWGRIGTRGRLAAESYDSDASVAAAMQRQAERKRGSGISDGLLIDRGVPAQRSAARIRSGLFGRQRSRRILSVERSKRKSEFALPGRARGISGGTPPKQKGVGPFSGGGACVMFSSLVAPHGSPSHSENMNMNAFKKTLVAIAAVATLGATGLVSTQASAGYYNSYGYGGYGGGMATASPPTATTAIPPTTAIPLTATATSPTATATAAARW